MKNSNDKSLRSMCARIGKLAAEIGLAVAIGAFAIGTGTALAARHGGGHGGMAAAVITAATTAATTVVIMAAIGVAATMPPDPTSTSRLSLMPMATADRRRATVLITKRTAVRRHRRASACFSDFDA